MLREPTEYPLIAECIRSGQLSAAEIELEFADTAFRSWFEATYQTSLPEPPRPRYALPRHRARRRSTTRRYISEHGTTSKR